jgi:lipopolysaccharide export system permease protein
VLRESLLPFLIGFSLVTFLFVIDFLFDYLDLLLAKGIPPLIVLELFALALGWIVALSFPCGVLVAALMTFGRLAQDNEVIAMRSGGVNVARILRGVLWASLVMAILLTLFNNYVLPESNHRFANLTLAIHHKSPAARIQPGIFIDAFDSYSLLVRAIDDRTGEMRDITIYDYSESEVPATILAREGHMEYIDGGATLKLDLRDGEIHTVPGHAAEGKYRRGKFLVHRLYLHNTGAILSRSERTSRGEREMDIPRMQREIERLESQKEKRVESLDEKARAGGFASFADFEESLRSPSAFLRLYFGLLSFFGKEPPTADLGDVNPRVAESLRVDRMELENIERRIDSYEVEIHKKFSIPFACVVFVLVGAPLGIRTRKGGFANMAIAVAFFVVYYLFLIAGEQLADRRLVSPALAMWLPNLLFGLLGAYLTVSVVGWGPSRGMR